MIFVDRMMRSDRPLRRGTRALGTLFGLLLLMACTAGNAGFSSPEYDSERAARLFTAGYHDIAGVYIEAMPPRQLAQAGLGELHDMDPRIALEPEEDSGFILRVEDQPAQHYALPRQQDYDAWGALTARVLDDARALSPAVAEADGEELYGTVFGGIVGELDGFSRYAGRDQARENRAGRSGFGGIGVRIRNEDDGVRILSVMEDTPAESAGLQGRDLILAIDGAAAKDFDQYEVVQQLRGPVNSRVRLLIKREEMETPFQVNVQRAHIVPQTVHYSLEDSVAVFRVTGFNHATTATLRRKLVQAEREAGDRLSGYLLDLRSNPGGLLEQSVSVADIFLEGGRIVSTHGRHPDSHQYFESRHEARVPPRPMVVLINGNSASASEIVAAALQDAGRALVVGSGSYGKGTVQTVLRLPNEGELTLTWARFHAPSGYSLDRRGVMPDVCTSGETQDEEALMSGIYQGFTREHRALRRQRVAVDNPGELAAFRAHCPKDDAEREADMRIAMKLLRDPNLYAAAQGLPTVTAEMPRREVLIDQALSNEAPAGVSVPAQ
ncbi:S41 family peptidase [Aquibaculum sediminis]|uniref:S41 family peptidase n=1 Tax=Aquibaculum sediminis TaxID=3231907 RepID=UPI003452BD0A